MRLKRGYYIKKLIPFFIKAYCHKRHLYYSYLNYLSQEKQNRFRTWFYGLYILHF